MLETGVIDADRVCLFLVGCSHYPNEGQVCSGVFSRFFLPLLLLSVLMAHRKQVKGELPPPTVQGVYHHLISSYFLYPTHLLYLSFCFIHATVQ